ncbi:outer membrane protein assembly factor BamB [Sesbania bispinosa]|nr:outer membrane protein assembly factor BamB [Sesbania bispinosa]
MQILVSLLQQDLLDVKPYPLEQGREAVKGNPQVQPAPEMEPSRGRFTAARREYLTAENGTATRTDRDSGRDVTEAPHRASMIWV